MKLERFTFVTAVYGFLIACFLVVWVWSWFDIHGRLGYMLVAQCAVLAFRVVWIASRGQ